MNDIHTKAWTDCLAIIKRYVEKQPFKTWFEPIKAVKLDEQVLTIQVPNKFFYEWLEEHYIDILGKSIAKVLGQGASLEYHILVDNHRKIGNNANKATAKDPGAFSSEKIVNPFVIPGIRNVKVDSQLNSQYTFDTYIEGSCNRLARNAAMAIASKPGGTAFNPLVLYGDVGLGKTHLAHAAGNAITSEKPQMKVLYVTTERFTNQVIQSIKNNATSDFMNFYQMIDVLIIDDIQFLANRQKTQEIFFNIFNQLHQNGKQIILTSDRPPKDLMDVQDRLVSRFKWGLSADLQAPDYETRRAILEAKMKREGLQISDEVAEFVCFNIKKSIRELEGVLISLVAQSTLNRREIDIDLAREVVAQFVTKVGREITVESIKLLVSEHMDVPVDKLQGKTRKRSVVIARQLSMYLAKNYTNESLKIIGDNFGGRDHSTVIYSVKAVKDLMDTDSMFKSTVSELEKKVQLSLH
jgi:chromosomal replication initiator protein